MKKSINKCLTIVCLLLIFTCACSNSKRETYDLLHEGTFTSGIEGPATDKAGNVYAVNYEVEGTIGIIRPDGSHSRFVTLPEGSTGNGIRFGKDGAMYVADYTGHNILRVDMQTKAITVFAHEPRMNQPNDIAMAPNGNIYASDPDWVNNGGQLWLISPGGEVTLLETGMGTTNGIEVSPDGSTLYVNESIQLNVWAYDIQADGTLINKRLFHSFKDYGMDGMRCDIKGNLYLCRYDKGTVVILSPEGQLLREIKLKGKKPSNITFGGKDNRQCYVTLQDRGCFETFIADFSGRE